MTPTQLLFVFLAALLVGLSKGGLGGILGALVVPLLSVVLPVAQAVGLVLPMLLVGDVFALRVYWRQWEARYVRLMVPPALVGVVMGVLLLTSLPEDALRIILGLFSLVIAAYKFASDSLESLAYQPRDWHGVFAGWLSGLSSALANAGGPPATAYMLLQKLPPVPFVGTLTLVFVFINVAKLPGFFISGVLDLQGALSIAWALPVIPLGVWLGKRVIVRLNQKVFENFMLILLVYAGVSLLLG